MPTNPTEPQDPLALSAPEKLTEQHDLSEFESGEPTIDEYLKKTCTNSADAEAGRCLRGLL
ncbi:hypothetical protein IBA8402_13730 [Pseudomonas syringae]